MAGYTRSAHSIPLQLRTAVRVATQPGTAAERGVALAWLAADRMPGRLADRKTLYLQGQDDCRCPPLREAGRAGGFHVDLAQPASAPADTLGGHALTASDLQADDAALV